MPSYTSALLPSTNGLTFGSSSLRWASFLTNPDITGTITYSGALSGITTISASGSITSASQLISTVATGTAPLAVSSTTVVGNLNVSQLLGSTWAIPAAIGSTTPAAANFTTVGASGVITSTVSTGTAPFTVASTTQVSNLNVSQLVGATWASPLAIGSSTPAAITSTTETVNTSIAIGGGTAVTKLVVYSQSLTPASVSANTSATQTFTVTGLTTADKILCVNPPSITAGTSIAYVWASAGNTISITFGNHTGGGLTPAAGTYQIVALRS